MIPLKRGFHLGAAGLYGVAAACAYLVSGSPAPAEVRPRQEFGQQATWQNPSEAEVRTQTLAWIADRKPDAAVRRRPRHYGRLPKALPRRSQCAPRPKSC